MRNNARTFGGAAGPAAVICAALALAACSETLGPLQGAPSKVAEVDADNPGANAGNIASLTDVIQRNPGDSVAYNTRGIAYAKAGNYKSAIEDFTKAVQIDPKFNAAYTNRALAFRQMGKDGPALADFNAAIAANPSDASAYLGRGNLLRSQNHLPEAMADLDAAIRLNPEGAQAYHARGLIYQRLGNNDQAITDFNNAIDRDPFAGAPYQARGQSLLATGKYDQAVDDFDAALNVNSNNAEAWAGLGLAYEKLGNKAKAVESYERATMVAPAIPPPRPGCCGWASLSRAAAARPPPPPTADLLCLGATARRRLRRRAVRFAAAGLSLSRAAAARLPRLPTSDPHCLGTTARRRLRRRAVRWLATTETSVAEARAMIELPYLAAFAVTRACLPAMLARGGGQILNVTSPASNMVWPNAAAYIAARQTLKGFSDALRLEVAPRGLFVSLVVLGPVESSYWDAQSGQPWARAQGLRAAQHGSGGAGDPARDRRSDEVIGVAEL